MADDLERVYRTAVGLNLVNDIADVWVPHTNLMIEARRKQQDQPLVESETRNAAVVLAVYPLLAVLYGIPEDDLAVHPAAGHELQLRHRYHAGHVLAVALHS